MESVLNINISCFQSYFDANNPKTINLLTWLNSTKYKERVLQIRATNDKKERDRLKATLPAITPSGIFSKRCKSGFISHSGLMCIDIDFKGNESIENFDTLKPQLCNIPNVAYCGLSVSANGYFLLIPIADPQQHESHFRALESIFKSYGIAIDTACKNVDRLRGYSYDDTAYFNHKALVFTGLYKEPLKTEIKAQIKHSVKDEIKTIRGQNSTIYATDTQSKVERCLGVISQNNIDITDTYSSWFEIGCSLSNEFAESGRSYYHQVSQHNPKYDYKECDTQFDRCAKHSNKITIASFFNHCKHFGVSYK